MYQYFLKVLETGTDAANSLEYLACQNLPSPFEIAELGSSALSNVV